MGTTWIRINKILLLDFLWITPKLHTCNFRKFFELYRYVNCWFQLDLIHGFSKLNFLLDSKYTIRNLQSAWGSYRNVSYVMFIEKLWSGCLNQFGHFLQFCRFNPPETFRPPTHTQTHHFSPGSKIAFFCIHWRREKKKEIHRIKWTSLFCKDTPLFAYFIIQLVI